MEDKLKNSIPSADLGDVVDESIHSILPPQEPERAVALKVCELLLNKELSEPISSGRIRSIAKKLMDAL